MYVCMLGGVNSHRHLPVYGHFLVKPGLAGSPPLNFLSTCSEPLHPAGTYGSYGS